MEPLTENHINHLGKRLKKMDESYHKSWPRWSYADYCAVSALLRVVSAQYGDLLPDGKPRMGVASGESHDACMRDAYEQGVDNRRIEGMYNTDRLMCKCFTCLAEYQRGQDEA